MSQQPNQTVLIFDSGVGGLSVYQEIKKLLPRLNYIYMFDNQAYPYGELAQEVLIPRVVGCITRLVEQNPVDLVVIACNTASTIVLPKLREKLTIPVVGVVPAIKPASSLANKAVGLIATPATVTREYTRDLIRDFAMDKNVEMLGSTRLVDMAEEKLRGKPIDLVELDGILTPLKQKVDVAVLGCTHFPLIKAEIQAVLGQQVQLIDSGEAIARRVKSLLAINGEQNSVVGNGQIFASAPPWQEEALNEMLAGLEFNPVRLYPLEGV
ncbi:glutamate racemase [Vibrio sp.]|uniref:glutamate racemase n=1 Tax=Vibrio sp. TaxID=678 RepID=UPI003D0E80CE